jgi:hypothetical protein
MKEAPGKRRNHRGKGGGALDWKAFKRRQSKTASFVRFALYINAIPIQGLLFWETIKGC